MASFCTDTECTDDTEPCKPEIECKPRSTRTATIEFFDKCPVPFDRLLQLNKRLCIAKKSVQIGWCQGQTAIGLFSKCLKDIVCEDPKAITDFDTFLALIDGEAGNNC